MTFIIGDIHGCYDELQALLDAAGISADEDILAIGDLVDKGEQPAQVLDFFLNHPRARSLMGLLRRLDAAKADELQKLVEAPAG